jgi:hypothetical protein
VGYVLSPALRANFINELLLHDTSRPSCIVAQKDSPEALFRQPHASVVRGEGYSYADQFLKELPVATEIIEAKSKSSKQLGQIAASLYDAANQHCQLQRQAASFPTSFEGGLTEYELDSVAKLCTARPSSAQLTLELESIVVEKALYGFEVRFGSQQDFEFEHREHAECLAEALRCRKRRTLPLKEVLGWRLPVKPEGCSALLKMLEKTRNQLDRRADTLRSSEDELNDLVYGIYGVTSIERRIIEDFLTRFSSLPAASTRQEAEEDESEDEE